MKGKNNSFFKKCLQDFICMFAMMFGRVAANSKCMCIYHDLEKPEELNTLRKF